MDGALEFRVLGPLEVRRDGAVLDVGTPKQRALLALLLMHPNEPVALDRIIDELWGDDAPPRATASLQSYVSNLRRLLEPDRAPRADATVLVSRPPGYALVVRDDELDASRFERLVIAAHDALTAGECTDALRLADAALAEWRGPLLADFAYADFPLVARQRLEELAAVAREDRFSAMLACGRAALAAAELEAATAAEPLRERLWELRMLALYRAGRQSDALRVYQDARAVLAEELGLEPGPALRALEQQILDHDPALDVPPTAPAATVTTRLDTTRADGAPPAAVVGRDRELDTLRAQLARVIAGTAAFAVVTGEAGVGKTTLVESFAHDAERSGATVVWGRSQEQAGDAPLWAWTKVVGALDHDRRAPFTAELAPLLDAAASPETDRLRVFDAVARLLATVAADAPLVVVLDDAHWADDDSLRLVEFLGSELRAAPVFIIATIRLEDATRDALAAALAAIARSHDHERIELTGLRGDAIRAFTQRFTDAVLDDATVAMLADRTNGNPFFLRELVRLLTAERRFDAALPAMEVPASVRDVVRRRIERLPADSQTVLRVAAIIGREFTIDLLAAACDLDADQVLDALEPPLLTGVLVETDDRFARLRFSHALVGETLVDDLPQLRRRRLHARVAAAIELVHARDLDAELSRLAHHYAEAMTIGYAGPAAQYNARAARRALQQGALAEADRLWRIAAVAAEHAQELTDADCIDLAIEHAGALMRAGQALARDEIVPDAIDRAAALDDPIRMGRAACTLLAHGSSWHWTDYRTFHGATVERLERAAAALAHTGARADSLRARVLATLSVGYTFADPAHQRELGREAVAIARKLGDDETLAVCLGATDSIFGPGEAAGVRVAMTELIEIAEHLGRVDLEVVGRVARADARFALGDVAGADADWEVARQHGMQFPLFTLHGQIVNYGARRHLVRGEFELCEAEVVRGAEVRRLTSLDGTEATFAAQLAELRREQGRLHELIPLLELFDASLLHISNYIALAHLDIGDVDGARATVARAGGVLAPELDWRWCAEAAVAANVAAALGDPLVDRLYAELLPLQGTLAASGTIECAGPVDLLLGRLARARGDSAAAEQWFRAALELSARIASPPWEAQSANELATVVADADQARTLAQRALKIADRVGMQRVAREAQARATS